MPVVDGDGAPADAENAIPNDTGLLRRIHPKQVVRDKILGRCRPASGAFKDKEMSVDAESILHAHGLDWRFSLRHFPGFSLVRFPAGEVRARGLKIVYMSRPPEQPDNPAHAHVIGTTEAVARDLAVLSTWVHLEQKK
jgi:hypothetical protein